ncbi:hypothetical protein Q7C36_001544 [Tachysurus vachellii]|uniref:CCHC-type domain-containing protein n=1 Tax=Tachysurus vachellii TaxID=175792 RepID=A0AA88TA45_TACVA|nr:hypothetical protein Q7C36_001544 [Tachysurus vachellii]
MYSFRGGNFVFQPPGKPFSRPESALPEPEPMQVDPTGLSLSERHGRLTLGLCLYCGASGHTIISCPIRPPPPHLVISALLHSGLTN